MAHWWEGYPWRMIQTNLREVDMEDMDAEAYALQLQQFGATAVLLNAAGIVAGYDTKLPFQPRSAHLRGDSLRQMIDACHRRGIRVICRTDFSKVRYAVYQQHPDWAYRTPEGEILNYNGDVSVCPNSEYQQERKLDILREVLTELPFDGVFCNMSGFQVTDYSGRYYGPCHCAACTRLFRDQYGAEIPRRDDPQDPVYAQYTSFKEACLAAHREKLIAAVRGVSPEIAINNVDYIRSESNTEIERPQWMYSASANVRIIGGLDRARPADNACVDFIGFRYRHISVSPQLMALRQWQNLANSGCLSLYIMGYPGKHPDTSSFAPTRRVFRFHAEHEALFTGMKSAASAVLVREGTLYRDDPEGFGWVRALTESHIPFDELRADELRSADQLAGKTLLILAGLKKTPPALAAAADAFARAGGTVIATGETGLTEEGCVLRCLGVRSVLRRDHDRMSSMYLIPEDQCPLFPRCVETPYIMPGPDIMHVTRDPAAQAYLRLIPEHPFGPPERCAFSEITEEPGILRMSWGKGQGIYLPFLPGAVYRREGYQNTLSLMQDVLFVLAGARSIAPELTPMTEVTLNRSGGKLLIQLVNTSGVFGNSYFDPLPIREIVLTLPADAGTQAQALNGGQVSVEPSEGGLTVRLDELREYEAIVVE